MAKDRERQLERAWNGHNQEKETVAKNSKK